MAKHFKVTNGSYVCKILFQARLLIGAFPKTQPFDLAPGLQLFFPQILVSNESQSRQPKSYVAIASFYS
jgi:hypothetical protein